MAALPRPPAHDYLNEQALPIVIKADGLAAGKGVIICDTMDAAHEAIDHIFDGAFGEAGAELVIEEFMTGEEASFLCCAMAAMPCPWQPRKTISAWATRTRDRTQAAWGLTHRLHYDAGACGANDG